MDENKFEAEDECLEEENFYTEDARSSLLDGDEISPEEAAFMKGYDEAG
ncbi:hypothetical protein ACFLYT_01560 [Nanoarchaeota archaeon]